MSGLLYPIYEKKKKKKKGDNMEREISLLDYEGSTDKNVDYRIKENFSGIELKGFMLTAGEMLEFTGESIRDGSIELTVEKAIQYKPWNFGNVKKGAGQLGIYQLKGSNDKTYFALIKDYRAFEGDWRIMLVMLKDKERDLKNELIEDRYGFSFMDYLFA
jgi:hypothetical protein